jgi:Bacterial archaeo-eukaryotic release factor family 12
MFSCGGCLKKGCDTDRCCPPFLSECIEKKNINSESSADTLQARKSMSNTCRVSIWVLVADMRHMRFFTKACNGIEAFGEIAPEVQAQEFRQEDVTSWLETEARKNTFDRLVLVADEQTLTYLHQVLSQRVQSRVVADVTRALAHLPENLLQAELRKIVWF